MKKIVYLILFFSILNVYPSDIKLGIDILIESNFEQLKDKNVALLTNFSGRTKYGQLTVDAFINQNICNLELILTPEHGLYTTIPAGVKVDDADYKGIPVHSLYGTSRNPDVKKFKNIDAIVVDIQDIGVRSYTYLSTMFNTMNTAANLNIDVYILDRPNPIGGDFVDGAVADKNLLSFVSIIPVAYIHGCTLGELAIMINNENWLPDGKKCNLSIIKMENWKRDMTWEQTELYWFPTSPNVPTIQAVRGLANLGIIGELAIISIGIGTTSPFQYLGIMHRNQSQLLEDISLNGVKLHKTMYRPFFGMYNGKDVDGYFFQFENDNFTPFTNSIKILISLRNKFPDLFSKNSLKDASINMFEKVTANKKLLNSIINNENEKHILELANEGLSNFKKLRQKYLLY